MRGADYGFVPAGHTGVEYDSVEGNMSHLGRCFWTPDVSLLVFECFPRLFLPAKSFFVEIIARLCYNHLKQKV